MLSIPKTTEPANGDVHKRRATRQRIETLAYADLGPDNGGFPINVSETGMAFQGIQPLETRQILAIKFKLPGMKEVVETKAQVVWLNDLGKGGGLEFIDLADESRQLILQWLASQTPVDTQIENIPAGPREVKKKEVPFPTPPPTVREGGKALKSESNAKPKRALSSFTSVTTAATNEKKSTADVIRSQAKEESVVQKSGSKRAWVIPFAAGLCTALAIMIGVMVAFGVISIRFHWPQQAADEGVTRPTADTGSAKVADSPAKKMSRDESLADRVATGSSAATAPPAADSKNPIAEPIASKVATPAPVRTSTTSTPKVESLNTPLTAAPASKAIAPSPIAPAKTLDVVPPSVALPTKPEIVPQLTLSSPEIPRPAPIASSSAPKPGKLEEPVLVKRKDPVYSQEAREKGISGAVELHFRITAEGNVRDIKVVKGNLLLGQAAIEAVQAWHYQPARLDGIPVEAESSVVVKFTPN